MLLEEISDRDAHARKSGRHELSTRLDAVKLRVPAGGRPPMHFDEPVRQVDEPEFRDRRRGVQPGLDTPILRQRRIGDLHHQQGLRRVRRAVIARGNDGDVRFRFRVVRQGQRTLYANLDRIGKRSDELRSELGNHVGVERPLRRHVDEHAEKQLDARIVEEAAIHE